MKEFFMIQMIVCAWFIMWSIDSIHYDLRRINEILSKENISTSFNEIKKCKEAGGINHNNLCLNPSAIIEVD